MVLNWRNRDKITKVVNRINEKVKVTKKESSEGLLQERRTNHLILVCVTVFGPLMGVFYLVFSSAFAILTKHQLMELWACEFNTWPWWFNLIYSEVVLLFCSNYYTQSDGQGLDCPLQLAFLYKVQYEKILGIYEDDHHLATLQLISVAKELEILREMTQEYLDMIWLFKLYVWSMCYVALATASVALTVAVQHGIMSIIKQVVLPVYVLGVMSLWSVMGCYFEETVRDDPPY